MHAYVYASPPDPPPPPPGRVEMDRAIQRAERAKQKFAQELDGLIQDIHEAREAIRADPLPGEGETERRDDE